MGNGICVGLSSYNIEPKSAEDLYKRVSDYFNLHARLIHKCVDQTEDQKVHIYYDYGTCIEVHLRPSFMDNQKKIVYISFYSQKSIDLLVEILLRDHRELSVAYPIGPAEPGSEHWRYIFERSKLPLLER